MITKEIEDELKGFTAAGSSIEGFGSLKITDLSKKQVYIG
jgi:hypothetical protein